MRDYGLGDYTKYIIGRPYLVKLIKQVHGRSAECPNCKMDTLAEIQVVLQNLPLIKSEEFSIGNYLSCPACPWASPMVVLPTNGIPDWLKF